MPKVTSSGIQSIMSLWSQLFPPSLKVTNLPQDVLGNYRPLNNTVYIDDKVQGDQFNDVYGHEMTHLNQNKGITPQTASLMSGLKYLLDSRTNKGYQNNPSEIMARQGGADYADSMATSDFLERNRPYNMQQLMQGMRPTDQRDERIKNLALKDRTMFRPAVRRWLDATQQFPDKPSFMGIPYGKY